MPKLYKLFSIIINKHIIKNRHSLLEFIYADYFYIIIIIFTITYDITQGPQNVFKFALLSTLNPFIDILGVIHIYPKDLKLA